MNKEKIFLENKGQKICCWLYSPNKTNGKAVVLAHGFTGDKDTGEAAAFPVLASELCASGFTVLSPDFRGTNESEGKFEDMSISGEASDLVKCVDFLVGKKFVVGVVGSSLAGPVTVLAYDSRFKAVVFWYPVIDQFTTGGYLSHLPEKLDELKANGRILVKRKNGIDWYVGKEFADEYINLDFKPFYKKITCPTRFITGDADTSVPWHQSEMGLELVSSKQKDLKIIHGADHCWKGVKWNEWHAEAVKLTVEWFQRFL